jgi:hypothetical protein
MAAHCVNGLWGRKWMLAVCVTQTVGDNCFLTFIIPNETKYMNHRPAGPDHETWVVTELDH